MDGILAQLRGFRNCPGAVLIKSDDYDGANKGEENGENEFAELECARRVGCGRQEEIFAYAFRRKKKILHRGRRDTEDAEKRGNTETWAGATG
ncbi:MAG: hypothetical protein WA736_13595, partial [Candidatus Acidiferrum sp.]